MAAAIPKDNRVPDSMRFWLKLAGFSIAYALAVYLSLLFFTTESFVGVFWPPSGMALAFVLIYGKRYAWGILAGRIGLALFMGDFTVATSFLALGNMLGVLFGTWLLQKVQFDLRLVSIRSYLQLIFAGAFAGATINGLIGVTTLLAAGFFPVEAYPSILFHWWGSNSLGIVVATTAILLGHQALATPQRLNNWPEIALIMVVAFLIGQVVFLDWMEDPLGAIMHRSFWIYPLVAWAAMRTRPVVVIALLSMVSIQVTLSHLLGVGYFANAKGQSVFAETWFYLMILNLIGMLLSLQQADNQRTESSLRIAAIAFECQEGMIVTDPNHVILRVNQSFCRIMGYRSEEVIGKNTSLMRSSRHPPSFYEAIWEQSRLTGTTNNEVWHRRKNGEVFPEWLTSTAVRDEDGEITHYVVTHTDITAQKQMETRRLAEEAAHRDALVREVHHRIKNNLQGITGLLRQTAQEHPEVEDVLNQAIAQVRSIAVIHGLQGRTDISQVRLCELTSAIAQDIESLWRAPIHVDIPAIWNPGVIEENEAVPIALVLNELIINAVKHGGKANGYIDITLRKGKRPESIEVSITNAGQWRADTDRTGAGGQAGLKLVDTLLPRTGAHLENEKKNNHVVTRLELEPPVITLEHSLQGELIE